ncbi:hypothetical protein ILYODFUR_001167 [Ilyodon furcidens]|uniref:Uncharacterized protein n=1 Tax=Ilyodon furcidens TaxID=33524 RepID=A0ABV0VA49_9TELE
MRKTTEHAIKVSQLCVEHHKSINGYKWIWTFPYLQSEQTLKGYKLVLDCEEQVGPEPQRVRRMVGDGGTEKEKSLMLKCAVYMSNACLPDMPGINPFLSYHHKRQPVEFVKLY